MLESLFNFFKKHPTTSDNEAPEGVCPNCWGKQEYDGVIRTLLKDQQIDVNNKQASHAFIQKFVIERIDGITLKKGTSGLECPMCTSS